VTGSWWVYLILRFVRLYSVRSRLWVTMDN